MRIFFDTSTMFAGILTDHDHHVESRAWLDFATGRANAFLIAGHCISELYATLTKHPRSPKLSPSEVSSMLEENVFRHAEVLTLDGAEYAGIVRDLVTKNLPGAIIHDAVIARTAELAAADRLVTLNTKHFLKVWNGDPATVVSPLDTTPPFDP